MAGGENPGQGENFKTRKKCLVDDLKVFRATEGCTEIFPLVFELETTAAEVGKWYRRILDAAETVQCQVARG